MPDPQRAKPVRYFRDEWLCMRNDPVLPKAIIRRLTVVDKQTEQRLEKFRAVTWSLEPAGRQLIGYFDTLEAADHAVKYDVPRGNAHIDGREAFGAYR